MIDAARIIPLDIHTDDVAQAVCQGAHYDADSNVWYVEEHELTEALGGYAYDMETTKLAVIILMKGISNPEPSIITMK